MDYNLLDEPWIPVLYHNGKQARVGVLKALEDAEAIRQVAAPNPMDRVAVIRFLLALLYWCKGNPPDGGTFPDNLLDSEMADMLQAHQLSFNMLGDGPRFMQDAEAVRYRPATDLIHELPSGNNFWHFRHVTDYENGICLSCCALGLLRLPLFSVSGLPNLKAGINGAPPVYAVPLGKDLRCTLLLNWRRVTELGAPCWEEAAEVTPQTPSVPLLVGLSLPSRRVWLGAVDGTDACSCCGLHDVPVVSSCAYETAGKQENACWDDPHVLYTEEEPRKKKKAVDLTATGKFRMDRPWTKLFGYLQQEKMPRDDVGPPAVLLVGFATDNAKYVDVWERRVAPPSQGASMEEVRERLEAWQTAGNKYPGRLAGASGQRGFAMANQLRPHIEHLVSARFAAGWPSSDEDWQSFPDTYDQFSPIAAESLNPGYTTKDVRNRRASEHARPVLASKWSEKKGGGNE